MRPLRPDGLQAIGSVDQQHARGPRPDGTVQPEFVGRLKEVGEWLGKNGETVYGTRGGPLPPGRFGDLRGLSDVVQTELLIGISVAIGGYRRTRVSDLRH